MCGTQVAQLTRPSNNPGQLRVDRNHETQRQYEKASKKNEVQTPHPGKIVAVVSRDQVNLQCRQAYKKFLSCLIKGGLI